MGCLCSKHVVEKSQKNDKNKSDQEYVNNDEDVKDNEPLLVNDGKVTKITMDESSSSSSVNQEMIQKLLDEIDASSSEEEK